MRGPGNVSGRTRGLIIDPDDRAKNTWFAGSVSGGIWKTTDAGKSWIDKTPDLPNMATTTLAMAQSNTNIIYAGTGEGFFGIGMVDGGGIYKSEDRGESWGLLPSTEKNADFQNINRIIIDPLDENIILVCTNTGTRYYEKSGGFLSGIFKSVDSGNSWTKVRTSENKNIVQQLVANPKNFNTIYAAEKFNGILKSTDAGDTWTEIFNVPNASRIELAIAPTDTSKIYLSIENLDGISSDFYASKDNGLNIIILSLVALFLYCSELKTINGSLAPSSINFLSNSCLELHIMDLIFSSFSIFINEVSIFDQ